VISVLYVDDEDALLRITRIFLERTGKFRVTTAASAREALSLMEGQSFDAIISDYQMPEIDGIGFLKTVRNEYGDIPFILFTGRGREEIVIEAINNGADFYLQKGGDPTAQFAELSHKVQQAVSRREAELLRNETDKRLADIINFLPDATFAIDKAGNIIAWNRAIEEMTDRSASEMLGKGNYEYAIPFYGVRRPILIDLIFEPDETIARNYAHILREKDSLIADTTLPRPRGRPLTLLGKASPLYDRQGNIVGAIESIRDITEFKKAEEGMLHAKKDWEAIFRAIGHPAIVLDAKNRVIDANDATLRITGMSLDQIRGKPCYEVFHGPGMDKPPDNCPFERLRPEGTIETAELEIQALNGYYSVTCTPVCDDAGNLEKVIHIAMDITDSRRTHEELMAAYEQIAASEEELRDQFNLLAEKEQRLQESESSLSSIFRAAPVGIGVVSDRQILTVNRRMCEITGYDADDLIGKSARVLYPDDDEFERVGREKYEAIRLYGTGTIETRWKRRDGVIRDILLSSTPIDPSNHALGVTFTALDITERNLMEEELRSRNEELAVTEEELRSQLDELAVAQQQIAAKQQQLEEITNMVPGVVYQYYARPDGSQGLYYINDRGADIFDIHTGIEGFFEEFARHIHPEDQQDFIRSIKKAVRYFEPWSYEGRFIRESGEMIWFQGSSVPVAHGSETVFSGILMDITKRKLAEKIQAQERIFTDAVLDTVPGLLFMYNKEGRLVRWNRAHESMTGYSAQELDAFDVYDWFRHDPAEVENIRANIGRVFQEGFAEAEGIIKTRSGELKQMYFTAVRIILDGEPYITGIGIDISDRRKTEDALRENEALYRSILHASPDDITITDREGIVRMVSPAALRIFGYEKEEEVIGRHIIEFVALEDRHRAGEALKRRVEGAATRPGEYHMIRADGTIFTADVNADFIRDPEGRPYRWVLIMRDISERKRIEQALHEANRKLNLLNGITLHDINNKVTAMQGYLEVLQEMHTESCSASCIQKIDSALQQINEMIRMTREYEQIGVHAPRWQDCHGLIDSAINQVRSDKVTFINSIPEGPELFADPLIGRVFYNLIDNAIRYGGPITKIRFSLEDHAIICEDDGKGIAREEKEHIFDRGFGKNTGLGLFLSREILAITGITIHEEGTFGKGARFVLKVPEGSCRKHTR
jgi:PAS domain S-box-containing protein